MTKSVFWAIKNLKFMKLNDKTCCFFEKTLVYPALVMLSFPCGQTPRPRRSFTLFSSFLSISGL